MSKTNFEAITENKEALSKFLSMVLKCDKCPCMEKCKYTIFHCQYVLKQWLESEVEE